MTEIKIHQRITVVLLAAGLLCGLVGHSLYASGMQGGYTYEYTAAAAQRTAAGDCYDPNKAVQDICVELCLLTLDGYSIPQNEFMCRRPSVL